MKILIISGFLGAGKTSFIKEMARVTNKKFVIVENEFSNLDLDSQILKNDKNVDMKVWELSEGCICCSLNLDFTHSILTISNSLDPEYLIVEPSGVALPSNILEQLNKVCYERIELLAPVVIVDAINFNKTKQNYSDYFNNQIGCAGTVVLSKSENLSENDFFEIESKLKLQDDVDFKDSHYSKWKKEDFLKLLSKKIIINQDDNKKYFFKQEKISEEQKLENISISDVKISTETELITILNILISGVVGKVVRAKGYFKVKESFVKFDLVDGQYIISGCEYMEDNRVVVIGKNLEIECIKKLLEK